MPMTGTPEATKAKDQLAVVERGELPERQDLAPSQEIPSAQESPPAQKPAPSQPKEASSKPAEVPGKRAGYKAPNAIKPPGEMNHSAMMKRLRRIVTPKENGEFKVPKEVVDEFHDKEKRENVWRAFEKSGYDPVFLSCIENHFGSTKTHSVEPGCFHQKGQADP